MNVRKFRKFRGGNSRLQSREAPRRRNSHLSEKYDLEAEPEKYDLEAGRPFDDADWEASASLLVSKRQKVVEKHREHLRRGISGHIMLSCWQRLCALLLSISLGFSLLGIIATLLSSELDALEEKTDSHAVHTEAPNTLYPKAHSGAPSIASPLRSTHRPVTELKFRRRLMGVVDKMDRSIVHGGTTIPLKTTLAPLYHALATFIRVTSLATDEAELPIVAANVLMGAANAIAHSGVGPVDSSQYDSNSLGPPLTRHQLDDASASLQLELQKLVYGMLQNRAAGSIQIPPAEPSVTAEPSVPASAIAMNLDSSRNTPILPEAQPAGFGKSGIPSISQIKKSSTASFPVLNGKKSKNAAFEMPSPKAGSAPNFMDVHDQKLSSRQKSYNFAAQQSTSPPKATSQITGSAKVGPEVIEIWDLPDSKHICRLYRVCKMQDGSVILPQWMERHSERIKSSCGLKKVSFLLQNMIGPTNLFAIRHEKKNFPDGIKLNTEQKHRDVFGESAPRDHMPHFVSDSFKCLASIEGLMGSGKDRLEAFSITPNTGGGEPSKTANSFPEMQPSLQIYDETMAKPPTDWVPSVVRMFSKLGFEFGPAGKEKPDEKDLKVAAKTGMCFRSAVVNNLKQYEPYGIFDEKRNNVLFTANGISREDAALLPGMKGKECTVTITALTRSGPRALLRLPELESVIYAMGQRLGIKTRFRVADFSDVVSIEDQIRTMQTSNVLVAAHGAGNSNYIFMRPLSSVIEIFPFSYRAGPFNNFASVFDLDYRYAMSVPQTDVFKECMNRHEKKPDVKSYAFQKWDEAVQMDKSDPFVHRLQFEAEFGKPGESEGMVTRQCVRMQELEFDVNHVASMAIDSARQQCQRAQVT